MGLGAQPLVNHKVGLCCCSSHRQYKSMEPEKLDEFVSGDRENITTSKIDDRQG